MYEYVCYCGYKWRRKKYNYNWVTVRTKVGKKVEGESLETRDEASQFWLKMEWKER